MKAINKKQTMCGATALPLVMLGAMLLSPPHAQIAAQPDIKQPGLAENPQPGGPFGRPRPEGRREELREGRGEGRPGLARPGNERDIRATIEQRRMEIAERSQQMRESFVRQALTRQGITDEKTHNAVLEHMRAEDKTKLSVQEKAEKLRPALQTEAMADAQFNTLLNDYLIVIEDYQDSRAKAAKKLDAEIGYTKKPRLHALLLTMGVVGDAPQQASVLSAPGMTFAMAGNAAGVQMPFRGGMVGGVANPDAPQFGGGAAGGGLVAPGFGQNPFANAAPPNHQLNERLDAMREEFTRQIQELREEMTRLKAEKRN